MIDTLLCHLLPLFLFFFSYYYCTTQVVTVVMGGWMLPLMGIVKCMKVNLSSTKLQYVQYLN